MHLRIHPRFCLIIIGIMLVAFGVSLAFAQRDLNEVSLRLDEVTAQRTALAEELKELQDELNFAQTDDYVIRVARDELGMIMPGEIRYTTEA